MRTLEELLDIVEAKRKLWNDDPTNTGDIDLEYTAALQELRDQHHLRVSIELAPGSTTHYETISEPYRP